MRHSAQWNLFDCRPRLASRIYHVVAGPELALPP